MLRGLFIRDMILIDRLELEFQPGLNVLTGETGAGKSILLDSLGFVLGWRGKSNLLRSGASQGEVVAEFDVAVGHPVEKILEQAGIPVGDDLILRRTNSAGGRKQAFVNDRRCSGEILRQISDALVEIHGQHDDRGLLNPSGHRALLDDFADAAGALSQCRQRWRALFEARNALAELRVKLEKARADQDYLSHAYGELTALAPEPGEDAILDAKRRLMQAAGRIREDIEKAAQALGLHGAEGAIGDAARWLQGAEAQAEGRLASPIAALSQVLENLDAAQIGVADCLAALDFNPHDLEAVEERLFAIRALARKHDVASDDLAEFALLTKAKLDAIEIGSALLADLEQAVVKAEADHQNACDLLGEKRRSAAADLDKSMARELAPLKMERAVFVTEIAPIASGPDGAQSVRFTVATNPGAPSGPLEKIASGGELSRFLLALKVSLSAKNQGVTMIFDEIDRGVGGATADAVGRRLSALAQQGQVLVVTHSPQVAALGAHHWRVEKNTSDGQTRSTVNPVAGTARVDEIARMLAGDRVTPEARAAAEVLLKTH
ncbi:MAG: DNA repair protein RecN [Alphaproteobacteria bacterium]|nr:DNA repair protein RecN [Alphaproteobacteria bacterium]